ncbi:MAG TPA: hypothetical protein VH255_05265, partial [Verrucomicrobiae bacterium]|nr:hypothetical protein [Verrucomicrobiae bacterium]
APKKMPHMCRKAFIWYHPFCCEMRRLTIASYGDNILICRHSLARETGEGAAKPQVRVISCVSRTDYKGKLEY